MSLADESRFRSDAFEPVQLGFVDFQECSEAVELLAIDFAAFVAEGTIRFCSEHCAWDADNESGLEAQLSLNRSSDVRPNALLVWSSLEGGDGTEFELYPSTKAPACHRRQAIRFFAAPITVAERYMLRMRLTESEVIPWTLLM